MLGTPRIEVDGEPLGVDTRKATALLAYLAVTGGVHGRDLLVDLLWPDAEPDRGGPRCGGRSRRCARRWAAAGSTPAGRRSASSWRTMRSTSAGSERWSLRPAAARRGIRPLTAAVMLAPGRPAGGLRAARQCGLRRLAAVGGGDVARGARDRARPAGRRPGRGRPRGRGDRPLPAAAGARPAARAGAPRADPAVRGQRPPRGGAEPVPRSASACSTASSACARCPRPASCTTPSTRARAVEWPAAPRADHVPQHAPDRPLVGRAGEWAVLREARRPVAATAGGWSWSRASPASARPAWPGSCWAPSAPRAAWPSRPAPTTARRRCRWDWSRRCCGRRSRRAAPTRLRPSPTTGGARLRAWFPRWAESPLPEKTTWRRSSGCTRGSRRCCARCSPATRPACCCWTTCSTPTRRRWR